MTAPRIEMSGTGTSPDDLLAAFWRYDRALLDNDVDVMNRLFAAGPRTLRGDGRTLLAGHEAITSFRSGRTVVPTRRVVGVHVRMLAPGTGLVVAQTRDPSCARTGLQTQVWQRDAAGAWQIVAAHVSAPSAAPLDEAARTWRVAGEPLVAGAPGGPLQGMRIAVKDLYAVAGFPAGAGVPAWLDEQPPAAESAPVLHALLSAGAEVTGIAHTDEFAYSIAGVNAHYGASPNPGVPHAAAGGSSSGPASAVAAGQADIGLGTDTAGSIRVPASYLGLVGLRTTHGSLDMSGVHPLAPDFDAVGWLTRDVATSRRVGEVLLPGGGSFAPIRTVLAPALLERLPAGVAAEFCSALRRLAAEGALPAVAEISIDAASLDSWFAAFRTWQGWQAWQQNGAWIAAHPGALGPDVAKRFAVAQRIGRREASAAHEVVQRARAQLRRQFDGAVLALPATSGTAPPLSATTQQVDAVRAATLRLTFLAPLAGAPAVSLPALSLPEPWTDARSPLGLSLVGPPGSDLGLLELADPICPETAARPR